MDNFEFEVRRPKYTPRQLVLKWLYGYSRKWEIYQKRLPNNGDSIEITWLPNIKITGSKNLWIGVSGVVFDMNKNLGTFCLAHPSGGTIVMSGGDFNYKITKPAPQGHKKRKKI